MHLFTLDRAQWLAQPIGTVFPFFAAAENLEAITPPWLGFKILTPQPIAMHAGTLIDYRIKLHGLPMRWRTEITSWEPPFKFVDAQLKGPYRRWIHTHTFEERDGGTLCRDHVEYAVPGGVVIERLFVRRQVEAIFAYRQQVLTQRFGGR